jgi:NAD(P)H-hydrate epimerase
MVIDADGLNILAAHRELIHTIPKESILTPHPKEFERLVGSWRNDFDKLDKLKTFSKQIASVIILKGAYTAIAYQGEVYFNPTGNPGMATGGTGDVLTGILTGLRAQHYSSLETARLGVYLHGLAGDLAAKEKGMEGLIASDLVEFLPQAFQTIN